MSRGLYTEFSPGETVWLDKDKPNGSVVTVIEQTPRRMFTTVKGDEGGTWDVMTIRLTKLKNNN
jgi:hypothetical protein